MKEILQKPVASIMNLSHTHNTTWKKVNTTHNTKPVELRAASCIYNYMEFNSVFLYSLDILYFTLKKKNEILF